MPKSRLVFILVASWLPATTGCSDSKAPHVTCQATDAGSMPDAAVNANDCMGMFVPGIPGGGSFPTGGTTGTGGVTGDGGASGGSGGVSIPPVGGFGAVMTGGFGATLGAGGIDIGVGAFAAGVGG